MASLSQSYCLGKPCAMHSMMSQTHAISMESQITFLKMVLVVMSATLVVNMTGLRKRSKRVIMGFLEAKT